MGRPLKHATSKPSRSMRQGNIAARVAKGNLGPTSATGYYNAFAPTEPGKYIVYKMLGASQAPLSFAPQTDEEFIRLANQEGAGADSIPSALNFFASDSNFTVAAIINTTGSVNVNPFCVYDALGDNPSPQNEWFNSVSPLDNMSIDNKEHALNEFIAMRSFNSVRWGAPYAGTIIYEIDTNGNISTKVSATSSPSNGDFNVTQGYRYVGNKPVHFIGGGNGDVMCPVSYYGTEWGWFYSRYTPQTVRFYCFVDGTKIKLYSSLTNSQITNDNLVTTLEGDEGDVVEYQIPTDPNYTGKYWQIHSNGPIAMTGRGSSGDMSIGALAGDRVYRRFDEYERTTNNTTPSDISTYTIADSTNKVWALSIADGSGGDNEVGHPLDQLSKNYTYGYLLRSYFVLSPYTSNTITISSWDGSNWVEFSSHTLNGTITVPVAASSGSQSGGDNPFNNNTLWKFEGDDPFYVVINDNSRDEEALLGWNAGEVDAFFM
jgi:hypothetical protein